MGRRGARAAGGGRAGMGDWRNGVALCGMIGGRQRTRTAPRRGMSQEGRKLRRWQTMANNRYFRRSHMVASRHWLTVYLRTPRALRCAYISGVWCGSGRHGILQRNSLASA